MMPTQLPDNWLDLAAAHGVTKWVKQFILTYLPQLQDQAISPEQFAQAFEEELHSHQLFSPAQQKNYRSNVVQALKTIDFSHPAIALVALSPEQYRELNDAQRGKLAGRETRFFTSEQAQVIVDRATALLESAEWSEVGAGLAVLIGRRISEILLSGFSLKSPWSLCFSEMSKKQGTAGLTIEIPTLAPAPTVLRAIERLQKGLRIEDLKLNSLSPKMAKQTVNARYSDSVAAKCVELFRDLVPARSDRDNLYTHIFRAVYATIATHWFCPPSVPEHSFKAEIQGHFTLTQDGRKLPNFSARANYDDYAIGTEDGNRDGRLGIKLGTLPELQVIEAFRKESSSLLPLVPAPDEDLEQAPDNDASEPVDLTLADFIHLPHQETQPMSQPTQKPKIRRPDLLADDLQEMTLLMAQRGITGSMSEVFHALLETFKAAQSEQQQQQIRTVTELTASLSWFTDRIDALESTCQQLQQERDKLQDALPATHQLDQLKQENALLKHQLQQTQSRLESIQQLLGMSATPPTSPPPGAPAITPPGLPPNNLPPGAPANLIPPSAPANFIPPGAPANFIPPGAPAIAPPPGVPVSVIPPAEPHTRRTDTFEKINQIIDALISWNTSQEDTQTQLRISIPIIKALATPLGASYQSAIQQVLKQRESELEEHHSRLLIGSRHNAGVKSKEDLLKAISRDYLGIENWHEVRFNG